MGKLRLEKGRGWAQFLASLGPALASCLGLPYGSVGPRGLGWLVSHDAPGHAGSGSQCGSVPWGATAPRGADATDTWSTVGKAGPDGLCGEARWWVAPPEPPLRPGPLWVLEA